MSHQGKSVLITIFKNLYESLKPRKFKGDIVGKDHLGNTYFQILGNSTQRKQRWFDPKVKDDFQQEIPAEWESWLRYRRKEPPTNEEVLANVALSNQKKINAAILDAGKKHKVEQLPPPLTGHQAFPSYGDEYEKIPGEKEHK